MLIGCQKVMSSVFKRSLPLGVGLFKHELGYKRFTLIPLGHSVTTHPHQSAIKDLIKKCSLWEVRLE
jgi:hypothetical protein